MNTVELVLHQGACLLHGVDLKLKLLDVFVESYNNNEDTTIMLDKLQLTFKVALLLMMKPDLSWICPFDLLCSEQVFESLN